MKQNKRAGPLKLRKQGAVAWSYFPSHSAAVKGTEALRKLKYPLQGINGVLDPNKSDRTIAGFQVVSISQEEYNLGGRENELSSKHGGSTTASLSSTSSSSPDLFGGVSNSSDNGGGTGDLDLDYFEIFPVEHFGMAAPNDHAHGAMGASDEATALDMADFGEDLHGNDDEFTLTLDPSGDVDDTWHASSTSTTTKKGKTHPRVVCGFLKLRKQGEKNWSYFPSHSAAVKGTEELRRLKHPLQGINNVLDPKKRNRTIAGFEVVSVSEKEYNDQVGIGGSSGGGGGGSGTKKRPRLLEEAQYGGGAGPSAHVSPESGEVKRVSDAGGGGDVAAAPLLRELRAPNEKGAAGGGGESDGGGGSATELAVVRSQPRSLALPSAAADATAGGALAGAEQLSALQAVPLTIDELLAGDGAMVKQLTDLCCRCVCCQPNIHWSLHPYMGLTTTFDGVPEPTLWLQEDACYVDRCCSSWAPGCRRTSLRAIEGAPPLLATHPGLFCEPSIGSGGSCSCSRRRDDGGGGASAVLTHEKGRSCGHNCIVGFEPDQCCLPLRVPMCCCLPYLSTYGAGRVLLGKTRYSFDACLFVPTFLVSDADGRTVYRLRPETCALGCCARCECGGRRGKCCRLSYLVRDPVTSNQIEDAAVSEIWAGFHNKCCARRHLHAVKWPSTATREMRATLTGSAILINITFKERLWSEYACCLLI
jgi:hypothetical protein